MQRIVRQWVLVVAFACAIVGHAVFAQSLRGVPANTRIRVETATKQTQRTIPETDFLLVSTNHLKIQVNRVRYIWHVQAWMLFDDTRKA